MTNLDRLADSDLLMQGFCDLVRAFLRAREIGLTEPVERGQGRVPEGEAPESLRQFYALWDEIPESCLGESVGMCPWEPKSDGYLLFARMITNWEFGVVRNTSAASTCPNDGWELQAYSENDGKWRSLSGVRLDHFLVEAGLLSLFSLLFSVRIYREDEATAERWSNMLAPAQPVWTGKVGKDLGIFNFEYTFREFHWDPAGILFLTEEQEYGFPREDGSRATVPFRYATFSDRGAWERFIQIPGCRRNDTGFVSQPVE